MKKKILIITGVLVLLVFIFVIYQIRTLQKAHSTFENYYVFRGCIKLVKKTDDWGLCQLPSGRIIKLVKFQDKWYLDGDLPIYRFNFL
ncbi:hypothetical protein M1271_03235 [Patescibacteria group bacterium]|nr:hypothetical protein [Patescibacteria group bacterium]MCL5797310.1 hypothetical protein [Patescibacteria group bacterium]